MKLNGIISVVLFLSVSFQVCLAQEKSVGGCKVINKSLATISLRYEKSENLKGQSKEGKTIVLRLFNNTNCSIFVPTENLVSGIDSDILKIGFLIQEKEQIKEAQEFYKWGDSRKFSRLDGGRYCLFTVPFEVFRNKFWVKVPFFYEWDFPDDVNLVTHQTRFFYGDLPSEILGNRK